MHDRQNLYFLFECRTGKQEPLYSKKFNIAEFCPSGDHIEFFLAPGTKGKYYQFAADYANLRYDACGYDKKWNSSWKAYTGLEKGNPRNYWVIGIIPFKDVNVDPAKTDTLRVNFFRTVHNGMGQNVLRTVPGEEWPFISQPDSAK